MTTLKWTDMITIANLIRLIAIIIILTSLSNTNFLMTLPWQFIMRVTTGRKTLWNKFMMRFNVKRNIFGYVVSLICWLILHLVADNVGLYKTRIIKEMQRKRETIWSNLDQIGERE